MLNPPNDLTAAPAQPNRSLSDGITVLLQLVSSPAPVGSRELARDLAFEPTRVNRLLGTLASLGMAQRTADRKYRAGPGVHVMAALSLGGSRLLPAALPHLETLRAQTGLGVALGVLWRRHVCYLFHGGRSDIGRAWTAGIAGHALYAAEYSSIGLALLAVRTDEQVTALYADAPLERVMLLQRRLASARRYGWADNEDRSLAVTVGRPAVAAIAVVGVDDPAPAAMDAVTAALRAASAAIADDLHRLEQGG